MNYDISIIIPFKNATKFLLKSINNSLRIIKEINAQIIYVDDCSDDNSYNILNNKIPKQKKIILLKTNSSGGPGHARNLGLKSAEGKKIIFLDIDDDLIIKNLKLLLKFSKKKNCNLINFGRILINKNSKINNFLHYNSNNLKKFFIQNNNMNVIFVLFEKKFIFKNNLLFNKGLHEDIFFLFKAHFYNKKKIFKFNPIVYKKNSYKTSIIHTLSLMHLKGMFCAWSDINNFLKKKLSKKKYFGILEDIQFRLRGEFANEYIKILKHKLTPHTRKKFISYICNNYKKIILNDFIVKTEKDKITRKILG